MWFLTTKYHDVHDFSCNFPGLFLTDLRISEVGWWMIWGGARIPRNHYQTSLVCNCTRNVRSLLIPLRPLRLRHDTTSEALRNPRLCWHRSQERSGVAWILHRIIENGWLNNSGGSENTTQPSPDQFCLQWHPQCPLMLSVISRNWTLYGKLAVFWVLSRRNVMPTVIFFVGHNFCVYLAGIAKLIKKWKLGGIVYKFAEKIKDFHKKIMVEKYFFEIGCGILENFLIDQRFS